MTAVNPSRQERKFIGYDWTFDIANNWSLTNRFAYTDIRYFQRITDFQSVDEITGLIQRAISNTNIFRGTISSNLDLKGKFETGPFNHSVLIGTDYFAFDLNAIGVCCSAPLDTPINLFAPVYSFSGYVKPQNNFFFTDRESWKGVYAQDFISFADDRLHLLFGGRYDWADTGFGFSPTSFAEANGLFNPATGNGFQSAFDRAFSPRLGAVVQAAPWLSFYGNYSQSFGATNAIVIPGQPPFPPQKGKQYEGGAKAEFFDKRLTATMAFYDITKSNIVQTVPGTMFSRPVGLVESKGVEFDIAGRINENWSLIGNYSFDDAHVTKDVTSEQGNRLQNVPFNAGSIWVKYDALGDFRGLSLGGGVVVVGERQGDNLNSFQLPAYARVDTAIIYRFQPSFLPGVQNLTAQLNVKNLFNTTYYLNAADGFSIVPGAPRTFIASLRAEF